MPDGTLRHAPLPCCEEEPGLLTVGEARARLLRCAAPVAGEEVLPLAAALGRVLAVAPRAARALPPFAQSAMDGYALHAADLVAGAAPRILRRIAAGDPPGPAIGPGEAVRVLTGAAVPPGAAAVVMEEHVTLDEGRVAPRRLPRAGSAIRRAGEDLAAGEQLLAVGTRLDARHLALLAAAAGTGQLAVRRRVRVALLSNGNELGASIQDSNRPMLAALLARPEVALTDLGIIPDDPAALTAALAGAARDHDLILASGGVSGSDADHLPGALRAAGGAVEVLRLAQKPGKPLAHGRLGGALCLFLPGNPLAALVGFLTLGRPLLARLSGTAEEGGPAPLAALAARGFTRKPGREEFLPARVVGQGSASGLPLVEPSGPFGSARLVPLAAADGLLWVPAATEQVRPGDMLRFHPFAASFGLA